MKISQAKIRFASVLLFAILAMNFMAAQTLRPGAGGAFFLPNSWEI